MQSKVTLRKIEVELKQRKELNKEVVGLEVGLVGIYPEGDRTFARTERKTPVCRPVLESNQGLLSSLHSSRNQGGGGPDG